MSKLSKSKSLKPTSPTHYNVLIIPDAYVNNFVCVFIKDFMLQLKKRGWHIVSDAIKKTGNIAKDLSKLTGIAREPDILCLYVFREREFKSWKGKMMALKKTLKVLVTEDVNVQEDIDPIKDSLQWFDVIFSRYPKPVKHHLGSIKIPVYRLSHGATSSFSIPLNFDKKKNVMLLSGAIDEDVYPIRRQAYDFMKSGYKYIEQRKHPGYNKLKRSAEQEAHNYATNINQYKLALADVPILNHGYPYLIAKHFEFMAANTAVITNKIAIPYLKDHGLHEGKHYIAIDSKNMKSTIEHWLKPENQNKLKKITAAGNKVVLNKHMTEHRLTEFDRHVKELFRKKVGNRKSKTKRNSKSKRRSKTKKINRKSKTKAKSKK